jgi:hypothetical protein
MIKRILLLALVIALGTGIVGVSARTIPVPTVLGGERQVWSEHGVPNGMSCDWYLYAESVGLDYCTHPGVDIEATFEPVYAAVSGVVEFAGWSDSYWPIYVAVRIVEGRYAGELHIYGHLSEFIVETGQSVERGEQLGISGTAGSGPHLHFERRQAPTAEYPSGIAINPENILIDRAFRVDKVIGTPYSEDINVGAGLDDCQSISYYCPGERTTADELRGLRIAI